mmetsp:Transcript_17353/g.48129  ORF Transcript_17353/g.48129 Transcript_17353/m.48129 type:complete len:152 (+) Transcript_17353:289-744(+)
MKLIPHRAFFSFFLFPMYRALADAFSSLTKQKPFQNKKKVLKNLPTPKFECVYGEYYLTTISSHPLLYPPTPRPHSSSSNFCLPIIPAAHHSSSPKLLQDFPHFSSPILSFTTSVMPIANKSSAPEAVTPCSNFSGSFLPPRTASTASSTR